MKLRLIPILMVTALVAVSVVAGQQTEEMSIEESYLQEAIEMMIIRETARSDDRNQKLMSLEYIGNAIERGNTNSEIRTALEYLSLEGTQHRTMEKRRLINDFPEVRRQAVKYLGLIGTEEAKNILIKVCSVEKEPMVLLEAIRALGGMESENTDDSVTVIIWVINKFDVSAAPDSLLALAAVEALDKIAEKNNGLKDPGALQVLIKIAEGPYSPPVKERAKKALIDLRKYIAKGARERQQQQ